MAAGGVPKGYPEGQLVECRRVTPNGSWWSAKGYRCIGAVCGAFKGLSLRVAVEVPKSYH